MSGSSYDFSKCHVAICTPAYGGQMMTSYVNALLQTMDLFRSHNIKVSPLFLNNESLVQRGRNTLVAQALAIPSVTHVLFIDSDISWAPQSILRLLAKDGDIVGGIYPHKHYAWERLIQPQDFQKIQSELQAWQKLEEMAGNQISPDAFIQKFKSFLMKFNIVFPKDTKEARVENGFVQVERIATGMMLIKRHVFEKMIEKHPDWKYAPNTMPTKEEIDRLTPFNYAFFDCVVEDGHYLSEDWYFCSQWRRMGGEVWADITMPLTHSGFHVFQGLVSDTLVSFQQRLMQIQSQQKNVSNTLLNSTPFPMPSSQGIPMKSAQEEEDPIKRLIREAEAAQKVQAEASAKQEEEEDPIKRLIREAEAAAAAAGGN